MADLVVDAVVLREVARRLEAVAGSLPGRAGRSVLNSVAEDLPGSRTAEAATATARVWSGDAEAVRTMAEELAAAIAGAADDYERTDAGLAERTS